MSIGGDHSTSRESLFVRSVKTKSKNKNTTIPPKTLTSQFGAWTVHSRGLKARNVASNDWREFSSCNLRDALSRRRSQCERNVFACIRQFRFDAANVGREREERKPAAHPL